MFVCEATLVRGRYGPRATRAVAALRIFYGVDATAKGKGPYFHCFPCLSRRPALRQPCVIVASPSFLHSSSRLAHFPITIAKSTNPSDRRDSTRHLDPPQSTIPHPATKCILARRQSPPAFLGGMTAGQQPSVVA